MVQKFINGISGYKTYITIGVTIIDVVGGHFGWWAADTFRLEMEALLAFLFTRMAVGKV
jgi:hypothetical protein